MNVSTGKMFLEKRKKVNRYRRLVKYFAFNQPDLFEDYQEPESIEEFY